MGLPSANAYVDERRGEIVGQATCKFADEWVFEAGSRIEASQISESGDTRKDRSFVYPKPRAVLTWAPDSDKPWFRGLLALYDVAPGCFRGVPQGVCGLQCVLTCFVGISLQLVQCGAPFP